MHIREGVNTEWVQKALKQRHNNKRLKNKRTNILTINNLKKKNRIKKYYIKKCLYWKCSFCNLYYYAFLKSYLYCLTLCVPNTALYSRHNIVIVHAQYVHVLWHFLMQPPPPSSKLAARNLKKTILFLRLSSGKP